MKIKMITLAAGPDGVKQPGQVYDVDAEEGKALIAGRYAEPVDEPKAKPDKQKNENDLPEGLKSLGSGWYELPNGEKAQGKENAVAAFEAWQAAEAQEQKLLALRAEAKDLGIENADEKDAETLLVEITAKKSG